MIGFQSPRAGGIALRGTQRLRPFANRLTKEWLPIALLEMREIADYIVLKNEYEFYFIRELEYFLTLDKNSRT